MELGLDPTNRTGPSFFEEHKQAIKGIAKALAAVALVAAIYAGIKTSFFAAVITAAIAHPILTTAILIAAVGITILALSKIYEREISAYSAKVIYGEKSYGEDPILVEHDRDIPGQSHFDVLMKKTQGFSPDSKREYLSRLQTNLLADGFYAFSYKEKVEIVANLIEVDWDYLAGQDKSSIGAYGKAYKNLSKISIGVLSNDEEGFIDTEDLDAVIIFTDSMIEGMSNPDYINPDAEMFNVSLKDKLSLMKDFGMYLINKGSYNWTLQKKTKFLIAFGSVSRDEFINPSYHFDRKAFVENYRKSLVNKWNNLYLDNATDSLYSSILAGYHKLAERKANELEQLAKSHNLWEDLAY